MVVMEVSMPSGFLIEKDQLTGLLHKPHVKLAHLKRGETVADIYIDQMLANEELCFEIQGYRSHKVAENKPVPVRIYDYYDSCKYFDNNSTALPTDNEEKLMKFSIYIVARSAREFYEIPSITSCEICEGDECSKSCKK